MMAVRVETTKEFKAAAAPEVLFATSLLANQYPYVVARDGRFLMPVEPRTASPITVLLNWQARLTKQ